LALLAIVHKWGRLSSYRDSLELSILAWKVIPRPLLETDARLRW